MNGGTFSGPERRTTQVLPVRLAARRPLRRSGAGPLALLLVLTGCASHHNPPMGSSASAEEAAPAVIPTSCEQGDTGCSCVDVDLTDYDRACNVASDCVAITAGTMCGASSCFGANAVVNVDSYALWNTDRQPVEYASCVPTTAGSVACVNNACVLQYPLSDGGTETSSGASSGGDGAGSGGGGDGSDDGVYIDLGGDDDDSSDGGSTAASGDDDDDDDKGGGSSSGDDDHDDASAESKHRPRGHASAQTAVTEARAAVTDTVK